MTYRLPASADDKSGADSRQFVVIAAGGHWLFPGPVGDAVVAFALPH